MPLEDPPTLDPHYGFPLQCYFCGKTTHYKDEGNGTLDPVAVHLIANFDRPRREQREQTFYTHLQCFKDHSFSEQDLEIEEPDFCTVGEIEDEAQSTEHDF